MREGGQMETATREKKASRGNDVDLVGCSCNRWTAAGGAENGVDAPCCESLGFMDIVSMGNTRVRSVVLFPLRFRMFWFSVSVPASSYLGFLVSITIS